MQLQDSRASSEATLLDLHAMQRRIKVAERGNPEADEKFKWYARCTSIYLLYAPAVYVLSSTHVGRDACM